MTAETLRRAAARIRETAQAATPGPWEARSTGRRGGDHWYVVDDGQAVAHIHASDGEDEEQRQPDAEHIALWHPGTAALVADLLDQEADEVERGEYSTPRYTEGGYINPHSTVMKLARQILGEA